MKSRRVSQKQIADDLQLSQSLVSLVLNGRKEGIAPDSYSRIWAHAKKLGYSPKGMSASNFQSQESAAQNVGFILRSNLTLFSQTPFFNHIQHGLHEALSENDIHSIFLGSESSLTESNFSTKNTTQQNLRGLVLLGEVSSDFFNTIRKSYQRIVTVSSSYPGLCHSVSSNEERSLELIIDHLVKLGHTRFAWLGGNLTTSRNGLRKRSLRNALKAHGLSLSKTNIAESLNGDRADGRACAIKLLKNHGKENAPTAWICFNGLMARGALAELAIRQIKVPEDISIAAVDATQVCTEDSPHITGASTDPKLIGRTAAKLILNTTGTIDETFTETILPSQLTPRDTTGPAQVD